ncbi:MAG TPA: ElyC/SanA/YdcF family protein, partial [Pyrinomonadaceae bacterium]|nr:ElyC/SanA/YdcF family protein [Pyrinomonadaceae bacterium]
MPMRSSGVTTRKGRGILRIAAVGCLIWPLFAWAAARALITESQLSHADAIVILANPNALEERTRRAAQLFQEGRSARILVTNENLRSRWSETHQRNLYTYEWELEELRRSGVPPEKIEVLEHPVSNTFQEALETRDYALDHGLRSLLVVTSAYHSRRSLWTFRQVFDGSGVTIGLESADPGEQTPRPSIWWLQPSGWKTVALEYPKLLYYWLRYRSPENADDSPARLFTETRTVTSQSRAGITLSLTAPTSAYVDEVVLIDARKSIGIPRRPQADGTPSVFIDFGDGFTCNLLACGHAYRSGGTYTITVSAKNSKGMAGVPVAATIRVAEIPGATALNTNGNATQNFIDMTNPRGNPSFYISSSVYHDASGNTAKLQNAIKRAAANNRLAEQEIVLPAGAVFAGPIVLPAPVGDKYITIRSGSLPSLPASGNRVGP